MPETRKYTKIRITDDDVHIEWLTNAAAIDKSDRMFTHTITAKLHSSDKPLPGFRLALQRFKPEVLKLLKLPKTYESDLVVRSVSITHEKGEDELRGIVITLAKTLEDFNSPFNIHTPYLREAGEDSDGSACIPSFMVQLLDELEEHASDFIALKRQQKDAFEDADEEQGELEEADAELETAGIS